MKILIYHFLDDPRFKSLTSTLNVLQGCSIGTCSSDTTEGEVKAFDPQLIVHNHPKEKELFGRNSIAINDNGYSLKTIKPFISLQQKREINQQLDQFIQCYASHSSGGWDILPLMQQANLKWLTTKLWSWCEVGHTKSRQPIRS